MEKVGWDRLRRERWGEDFGGVEEGTRLRFGDANFVGVDGGIGEEDIFKGGEEEEKWGGKVVKEVVRGFV